MSVTNLIQTQTSSFPYNQITVEKIPTTQEQDDLKSVLDAETGFLERWNQFGKPHEPFALWTTQHDEITLRRQFKQLNMQRLEAYVENAKQADKEKRVPLIRRAPFDLPKELKVLEEKASYHPISFAYNRVSPFYNASLIHLHGLRFIAMEAPTEDTEEEFFRIIESYDVSTLVRLTPAIANNKVCCTPYWEDSVISVAGETKLTLYGKSIFYVYTDAWIDQHGLELDQLYSLVMQARQGKHDSFTAVHCVGGRGRTGTFIAACVIAHDIDDAVAHGRDSNISIEKIVWELSLQRGFAVANFTQYLTLHRFVQYYVQKQHEIVKQAE
jgi:protein tyrosine phosphatase